MNNQPPPTPGNKRRANASPRPTTSKGTTPHLDPTTEWIALGVIVAPFGLHGEVKLLAQTDFPDRINAHEQLYLGPDHQPFTLLEARTHGGVVLLRFDDVPDLTAAETLRGRVVYIPETEMAPLDEDQYYIHDLIGLRALHVNGTDLGTVADVFAGGAQELLSIHRIGHPSVLVPLVKALVPAIDLATRTVTIDPPTGLFDDDAIIVENDATAD